MQKTGTVKAGKDRAHEDPTDVYEHLIGRDEDKGARLSSESLFSLPLTAQWQEKKQQAWIEEHEMPSEH